MENNNILSMGKHAGKSFQEVKATDIAYCNWVLRQMGTTGRMKEFQNWLKANSKKTTCEACNGTGLWHTM